VCACRLGHCCDSSRVLACKQGLMANDRGQAVSVNAFDRWGCNRIKGSCYKSKHGFTSG
jgi:hypothetical protein